MTTWTDVSAGLGRNDMPYALAMAVFVEQTLTDPADIADGVVNAWCSAEWPAQCLDESIWWNLFDLATEDPLTYLHDHEVRDRADLPATVTLYRGAVEEHKYGMSWTDDLARATWFAHRFDTVGGEVGKVWQVTVDSDMVLARFESRRGEAEWVLDPHLLEEHEVVEVV